MYAKQFGLAAVIGFAAALVASNAEAVVVHRYDFETPSGVTEPGWTHVDATAVGSPTTHGFLPAAGGFFMIDRGSSIQSPISVTRDVLISSTDATPATDIIFRDIAPAEAVSVSFTIYRSDPADGYAPNYVTSAVVNGGSPTFIDGGTTTGGTYFAPITGFVPLTGGSGDTLDFLFSSNLLIAGNSIIRINGIELTYAFVPEPGSMVLTGLGALGLLALVRRKQRSC